jgi:hypothetical protein
MASRFVLAKPLYDALPVLYVFSGFVIAQLVDSWLAFASGALFTMAGVLVFKYRIH